MVFLLINIKEFNKAKYVFFLFVLPQHAFSKIYQQMNKTKNYSESMEYFCFFMLRIVQISAWLMQNKEKHRYGMI
jgi:uncharacterized membrane protein YbaN (DUF454 family)